MIEFWNFDPIPWEIIHKPIKFKSTIQLTLSNMSKLMLHFSNLQKIVFWPWSGVKWGKINMCHKIKKLSNGLMNHFPRYWVKIPKFDNYQPPLFPYQIWWHFCHHQPTNQLQCCTSVCCPISFLCYVDLGLELGGAGISSSVDSQSSSSASFWGSDAALNISSSSTENGAVGDYCDAKILQQRICPVFIILKP